LDFIRFAVTVPVFAAMGLVKDLTQLARFNSLGIVSAGLECGGVILGGFQAYNARSPCITTQENIFANPDTFDAHCRWYSPQPRAAAIASITEVALENTWFDILGQSLSVCVFSLSILSTVPSYRAELAERREGVGILRTALTWISGIFIVVMICGYVGFGNGSAENIMVSVMENSIPIGLLGSLGVICGLCVSTPVFLFCVFKTVESTGTDAIRTRFTPQNIIARISTIIVVILVSWGLPYASEVIGLIGAVFGVCNNLFFPVLFHILLHRKAAGQVVGTPQTRIDYFFYALIVLCGACTMLFGVKGGLAALQLKMRAEAGGAIDN